MKQHRVRVVSIMLIGISLFMTFNALLNLDFRSMPGSGNRALPIALDATIVPSAYYPAWERTWGGPLEEIGRGIWGNETAIYTTGWVRYTLGNGDIFLVRWDLAGNVIWNRTWGGRTPYGTTWDEGSDVWSDGTHIFVVGSSDDGASVIKWDATGNVIWNRTIRLSKVGGASVFSRFICGDGAGNIFFSAGWSDVRLIWDGSQYIFLSDTDTGIFKMDATTGALGWNYTRSGWNDVSIIQDAWCNGTHLFAVGTTNSTGAGSNDMFLACFTTAGNMEWMRTWGGALSDGGSGIWGDGNGSIYTTGSTNSFGAGASDAVLVKWNTSGDLIWNVVWGGAGNDYCSKIWGDGSGLFYTCGFPLDIMAWNATAGDVCWTRTHESSMADIWGLGNSVFTCGNKRDDPYTQHVLVKWAPNTAPVITPAAEVVYSHGATGNTISWNISDSTPEDGASYIIRRNGTQVGNGSWTSGSPVTCSVDGLSVGTYNYTIIAQDRAGGFAQDSVLVTVLNVLPIIEHGIYGNEILWWINDTSRTTITCVVYHNGKSIKTVTSSSAIVYFYTNITGLPPGIHNFTIVVNDGLGGISSDTVFITVEAPPNSQIDPGLIVAISLAGVAVVVIGAAISKRKRSVKGRELIAKHMHSKKSSEQTPGTTIDKNGAMHPLK
ncbi:MAG: hypothetical protein Q6373_010400 [Candidatus Sigynarchaeota archaeon]